MDVMLGQISSNQSNQYLIQLRNISVEFGLRFFTALLILIIGRWVADASKTIVKRGMVQTKIEPTLTSFASNIFYYATLSFFVLAALGRLGIETTSLIAILGAAGLAIGLALQGSLSNFAAGILIILFHPFRAGDWIEAAGINGIVEEIQIFTTVLRTLDNRTVIVPNSKLTDGNIINYSAKGILRVDLVIGVAYEENLAHVKQFAQEVLASHSKVLTDPKPTVGVLELADSSVNLAVRPWTKTEHYWDVYFGVQEALKTRFDEVGISIPFPQRDIRLIEANHDNSLKEAAVR
ncbi:MAG: mechanosensitive ion channel domain-containing protein [Cyanobacteria bacterium P01_H01_bin.105]